MNEDATAAETRSRGPDAIHRGFKNRVRGRAMIAQLAFAAALAGAAPDEAGPPLRIEHGRITQVSPRPTIYSGYHAVFGDFEVAAADGTRHRMYMLWPGGVDVLPDAGRRCTVTYRRGPGWGTSFHGDRNQGDLYRLGQVNMVETLDCGFSMGSRPLAVPIAPAAEPGQRLPEPGLFPWAHVVRVSPRPCCGSGVIMFTTDFDVQTLDGGVHRMSMIYAGELQFIPPVGSICQIRFAPSRPISGYNAVPANSVDEVSCDTGREPVRLSDDRARIDGVRITGASVPPLRHARQARYATLRIDAPGLGPSVLYWPVTEAFTEAGLPAAGGRCSVIVRYETITGRSIGDPRLPETLRLVAERLDCGAALAAQRGSPSAR